MVKIRVKITCNVNIFIIYETLYKNITAILPIAYENKTKMPWKNRKCLVYFKSFKLFQLHTIYLSIIYGGNVYSLDRHAICLKFGGRFFTPLTMLGLNQKKSNFLLSPVFSICWRCYKLTYFNNKVCLTKNAACKRNN